MCGLTFTWFLSVKEIKLGQLVGILWIYCPSNPLIKGAVHRDWKKKEPSGEMQLMDNICF